MALPKFNQEIKNIVREELNSKRTGSEGIIIAYHPEDQTVDVALNKPNTHKPGEFLRRIPIPLNMGVQGVAPIEGQYCFVSFKDGNPKQAFLTALYPSDYQGVEKKYHEQVLPILPRFFNKF
jgi:hypothetical protein